MMGEQRHRAYGKGARMLLASLAACRDVVIWAIGLRPGAELRPWAPCPRSPRDHTSRSRRTAGRRGHHRVRPRPAPRRPRQTRGHHHPPGRALVIIINEYAELADDAPDAMSDTGTIARLGRAPAVTLLAATQRPTQKVMGQGAVRSQMNIRISFRVRRTTRRRPHPRTGQAHGRLARPQAQRPRQVPHLRTRTRHPSPRSRLPRHRRGRSRHSRPATRPPAPASTASPMMPWPVLGRCRQHRNPPVKQAPVTAPPHQMTAAQPNRPPPTTSKARTRSCDARCPPRQPKAFPSATSSP